MLPQIMSLQDADRLLLLVPLVGTSSFKSVVFVVCSVEELERLLPLEDVNSSITNTHRV